MMQNSKFKIQNSKFKLFLFSFFIFHFSFALNAPAQTGGAFTIEKSVIAPGGTASGGTFIVQSVISQPSAGNSSGGQFSLFGGFLTPQAAPTAAAVSISGRVTAMDGAGIRNAFVVITDTLGNERTARTGAFGYFRFDEVEVGQTYIFSVRSKRFQFVPQVITVSEDIGELNFTAL